MTEAAAQMQSRSPAQGLYAQGLTVTAGGATLVREATFHLQPGELVTLLGPNGAGKTSLLRGAIRPDASRIGPGSNRR